MKKTLLLFTFFKILISCNDKENISNKENIKDTIGSNNNSNSKIERKIIRDSIKFESYLHFSDFNVKVENVNAKIDLKSHELGKLFRTAIQKDYEDPELIFAGHYTLAFWGCGSPCQMSVIIDKRNGKIYDSPTASLGYKFQKNSRLLITNPPDSLGYYDNCSYCKPEVYILNEKTKKFELIELKKNNHNNFN